MTEANLVDVTQAPNSLSDQIRPPKIRIGSHINDHSHGQIIVNLCFPNPNTVK